jgi:SHS2 domain-containing protein
VYRWAEHTGELELQLEAETRQQVFTDALAALAEVVRPDEPGERAGTPARYPIEIESDDPAGLLADWLSELVFLADTQDFVPERAVEIDLAETSLRATVEGVRDSPSQLVKAITYHGLELVETEAGFRARVVLDV